MGKLSMSRTEPCGEEPEPTPAFDEIISIVAPAMRGDFDGPVEHGRSRALVPVRLERSGLQDSTRSTRSRSTQPAAGTMTPASGGSTQRDLSVQQRDTLRLLIARISEKPVVPCTSTAYYRLQADMQPAISGPDCAVPGAATGVPCTDRATGRRIQPLTGHTQPGGRSMRRPSSATLTLTAWVSGATTYYHG